MTNKNISHDKSDVNFHNRVLFYNAAEINTVNRSLETLSYIIERVYDVNGVEIR